MLISVGLTTRTAALDTRYLPQTAAN